MAVEGEELDWVRRARQGDTEAFAALVSQYQKMIDALTWRMTGSLAEAEDLTQEVFIQAYQNLARFEERSRFSSWLYRIALNRCLNWRQAAGRRTALHAAWAEDRAAREDGHTNAPGGITPDQVQAALLQLPPEQRAAIVLTVYDELNHAEAARLLGCSEPTVSWRIFVARRKLKRLLTRTGAHPEDRP